MLPDIPPDAARPSPQEETGEFQPPAGFLMPGHRPLPDYELIRQIGKGGFGEVWMARAPGGVKVALKFIHLGHSIAHVEQRSLELIRDVRHPNLMTYHGTWVRDGYLIIAMELADKTLLNRLQEVYRQNLPGIPRSELLPYLHDAAKGIDYLNQIGIQHRDIKPENLMVVGGGIKVGDFGLAKFLERSVVTASGSMTPAYAAPEFFHGQATKWSDQYALAITYCQLLANQMPFEGSGAQIMAGHLTQPPNLTMLPSMDRPIVARALAKQATQRWPNCQEFILRLQTVSGSGSGVIEIVPLVVTPSPSPPPSATPAAIPVPAAPRAVPQFNSPTYQHTPPAEVIKNVINMKLVLIPSGSFLMGAMPGEIGSQVGESPQHEVEISRPFYMGMFAVLQREFDAILGSSENRSYYRSSDAGDNPVEKVSWLQAVDFCKKLSSLPEERHAGRYYRLPTEAEWEYACRAGTNTPFYFGESLTSLQANFDGNYPYGEGEIGPSLGSTSKAGSYPPNPFGLYDMHGNVLEWCADWFHPFYYESSPPVDPPGPHGSPENRRVLRGGCFSSRADECRSAARHRSSPTGRYRNHGFRVVMEYLK
jgi:formylglycine-generating enzyme required for sulfatase activity